MELILLNHFYNNNYFCISFFYFIIFLYNNYKFFFFYKYLFKNVLKNLKIITLVIKKCNNWYKLMKNVTKITVTTNNTGPNTSLIIPVVLGGISLIFGGIAYFFLYKSGIEPTVVVAENQINAQQPILQMPQDLIINHNNIQIIDPLHVVDLNTDIRNLTVNKLPRNLIKTLIPVSSFLILLVLEQNKHIFGVNQNGLSLTVPSIPSIIEVLPVVSQAAEVLPLANVNLIIKKLLNENINSIISDLGDDNYYLVQQEVLWAKCYTKLNTLPSLLKLTRKELTFLGNFLKIYGFYNPKDSKAVAIRKEAELKFSKAMGSFIDKYLKKNTDNFIYQLLHLLYKKNFLIIQSNEELSLLQENFICFVNDRILSQRLIGEHLMNGQLRTMFVYNIFFKKDNRYTPVKDDVIIDYFISLTSENIVDLISIEIVQFPQYNRCKDYNELQNIVKNCLKIYLFKNKIKI